MSEIQNETTLASAEMHQYAANLLIGGKNTYEIKEALLQRGLDEQDSIAIIDMLELQMADARKAHAKKEMLYGALWCVGGTALTLAHVGFIFWGAIIFGAIQFFRGLSNYN